MVLSKTGSTAAGSSAGGLLGAAAPATVERRGSLASPLPPGPTPGAPEFQTSNAYCRAVHGALASYRASSSAQRVPLTNLSAAEHTRRSNLIRVPDENDVLMQARQTLFSANLTLFASPFATNDRAKDEALSILLTASACDERFGFSPVTRVVSL